MKVSIWLQVLLIILLLVITFCYMMIAIHHRWMFLIYPIGPIVFFWGHHLYMELKELINWFVDENSNY